ncbi:uncharacterized protein [Eurosta solidaginis]|uniref:uncharacterized protein isoform X1 n=1 Tax=Eurosta solidaginis TaxID=178769 RepID=UPI003530E8FD
MVSEGNKNRYSQLNWLKKYEWLAYSKIAGGGLCKMRVLFGRREASSNDVKLGKLVSEPLSKYKKAIDAIKHHESNNYHKANMVESKNFLMVMEGKSVNVFERMRSQEMEIIKNNGEKLILIIKTIILCGRENIPLRSHRDDGSLEANSSYEHGEGNFRALLKFRVDAGDMILQEHAEKFAANASYPCEMWLLWKLGRMPPWNHRLCRILATARTQVMAIDIGTSDGKEFPISRLMIQHSKSDFLQETM